MSGIRIFLAAALVSLLCFLGAASAEAAPARRALLIGCDHFLTQPDTWPAAEHNLALVQALLEEDSRGYADIRACADTVVSPEDLRDMIREVFGDAQAGDVSLLYLSTHGVFDDGGSTASAALILSDGKTEEMLYAPALEEMLSNIPGIKVLILDACNSGAFIGKGLSGGADRFFFSGPEYKVLCSAGGSEASWYFHGAQDPASSGASYFATVLTNGLGGRSGHAADTNDDGEITLQEAYLYLLDNYAASTPQVYPQEDGAFALYACGGEDDAEGLAVTDITFDDTLLTAGQSEVSFSFTVRRQTALYYQIVYHQNGAWQFDQAQHYLDAEQEDGTVLPGRKARTLSLDTGDGDAYGYVILQMITLENDWPVLQGARLLCVAPAEGEVSLNAAVAAAFVPSIGQELSILAQHDVPCGLTVNILDEDGTLIRRLAYEAPSRPQQLSPAASAFYWNGLTADGEAAPPGDYTVQLRVRLGGRTFLTESAPFRLLTLEEAWQEAADSLEAEAEDAGDEQPE